ncbi:hypothetical protein [Phycicoccus avicenniae]|uniref:hypothetical protein n=1 Tax=Phycicoccus avicenniae TaxID=2828860 RepID=UPI003D287DDA
MGVTTPGPATTRVVTLAAAAGLGVGAVLGVVGTSLVNQAETPSVERAVIDSVDTDGGMVCLRQETGSQVDCFASAVAGLSAGDAIDYSLTTAATDPSAPGSGTHQVFTWAVPVR